MRRAVAILSLLATVLIGLGAPNAWADSPQFQRADATILTNTGALQVVFKETGLGLTTVSETVTLRIGFAAAEYQCFNGAVSTRAPTTRRPSGPPCPSLSSSRSETGRRRGDS